MTKGPIPFFLPGPNSISYGSNTRICRSFTEASGSLRATLAVRAGGSLTGRMPITTSRSGVGRLTRVQTGDPRHLSLTDDHLFDYPWIYATQTGWWNLSDRETARLREYLERGGFLVTDDFWGAEQWEIFRETMKRVLPGQAIVPLAESDPVMHVMYDIQEKDRTFIPGTRHLYRGEGGKTIVRQPPGSTPGWFGMYDERNRLVVAINFNTDVGDAWEYADSPEYPEQMTALAYRYGINYLIYSMTH